MKLLLFECKKLFFTKRFLYTIVVLMVLIIGLFVRNWFFQDIIAEQEENRIISLTREVQENLRFVGKEVEVNPENENSQDKLSVMSEAINLIYEWRPLIDSPDWQQRLETESQFLEAIGSYKDLGGEFSLTSGEITRTLALNEELLAKGIQPEDPVLSTALPNFFLQLTQLYVNAGAIILFVILAGDLMTNEFEQRSIQFLFTQPVKKSHILHAKGISMALFYSMISITILGIGGAVAFLFGDAGNWQYPVQGLSDPNEFIPISTFVSQTLLATTVAILAVIGLVLLISVIIKQSIGTFLVTLVFLFGGYLVFLQLMNGMNPFGAVFAGRTVQQLGEVHWLSYLTLGSIAIVTYGLAIFQMKRVA